MGITGITRRTNAFRVGTAPHRQRRERSGNSPVRTLIAAVGALIAVAPVNAQTWRVEPSIGVESTLTDNVDLAPAGSRRADWVNQLTPGVRFSESSAHTKLAGSITLPVLLYARTSENDYLAPQVNITGTFEALDRFLFIDAAVSVSQQYASPFGPRPTSLVNATTNRYTAQNYAVSPYIRGASASGLDYELRQRSTWSDAAGLSSGIDTNRSYTSEIAGHVIQQATPAGWALEYYRSDLNYVARSTESTQIGRGRLVYQMDFATRISAIAGYEDNHFFLSDEHGTVYGAAIEWHPTDRTGVNAQYEHRFFGASYAISLDHRTPLTVASIRAARDLSNYPQQLGTLPGGADIQVLLNTLFAGRIADPAQRQTLIDQFIRERGLPGQLTGPLPMFAQQFTLLESVTGTFGILGARNSIFFSAFRSRNAPLPGTESLALSNLFSALSNNTQIGSNVIWTHQLEPNLSLSVNANWSRTTDDTDAGAVSRQFALTAALSRPLSPRMSVHGGARFQRGLGDANALDSYREFALFAGLTYSFK